VCVFSGVLTLSTEHTDSEKHSNPRPRSISDTLDDVSRTQKNSQRTISAVCYF